MRSTTTLATLLAGLLAIAGCAHERVTPPSEPAPPPPQGGSSDGTTFQATAYSVEGKTASGARTREGIVAADPAVLPLGSRIRVSDAGEYSGEYVVKDTGRAIKGRELDIYLADDGEAKRFGERRVKVHVLERGTGSRHDAQ